MINANLSQFLDTGWFSEATLYYKGWVYWCEANWEEDNNNPFHFFVYRFPAQVVHETHFVRLPYNEPFKYEYEVWGKGEDDVKEKFLQAKIFEGKSFWEVEQELAWYDE